MRLWTIHPKYLDVKGLLAVWREGLLAQKVLAGKTKGYGRHPQLERFLKTGNPQAALAGFLWEIFYESKKRGYAFDKEKILSMNRHEEKIAVTKGQIEYEFTWLKEKLKNRNKKKLKELMLCGKIEISPVFKEIKGGVEKWERVKKLT